jgi:putative nucleotidyltransferase with HDIG domain
VTVDQRVEGSLTDMATIKRLYSDAVSVAGDIFDSAQTEGRPDATAARSMIDGLAQAVAQNRTALLALTTLKNYDNYTFTHMVNVSILTMGQARGLGIDGPLLREFGLAALMHDIGKVRTPLEILNKPDKLTDEEFTVMKQHVVDGAEILRATPDVAIDPAGRGTNPGAVEREIRVKVTNNDKGATAGQVRLDVPAGWRVTPQRCCGPTAFQFPFCRGRTAASAKATSKQRCRRTAQRRAGLGGPACRAPAGDRPGRSGADADQYLHECVQCSCEPQSRRGRSCGTGVSARAIFQCLAGQGQRVQ